ncbi:MAG: DUF4127 family protein [Armatimonadetes bacterium]|nr:DUF4127 family protein [Armatimonadota bacterium]
MSRIRGLVKIVASLATLAMALTGPSQTYHGESFVNPILDASPKRILLIPLDDRPATNQFAQMIGEIADVTVDTPPREWLGRFTIPGKPDYILDWLERRNLAQYDAVIVNTDMVCYGGLIASRTTATRYEMAIRRLRRLWTIRKKAPATKFYAFSAIMRIAPTSLKSNVDWRDSLTTLAVYRSKITGKPTKSQQKFIAKTQAALPAGTLEAYDETRRRNHKVQQELVRMLAANVFDYMVLGQDDAQKFGPHVAETAKLESMASNLKATDRVYFCEGIDQHANVLLSRAMLASSHWSPRVKIIYADQEGRALVAPYETETVEHSVMDQLVASGAEPARGDGSFDYALYINTPKPREAEFDSFVGALKTEVDQGFPVAVADINLGVSGTGDPRLFDALSEEGRSMKLLSYAGWNTAGNTIGTTIPAANVYLYARKREVDPLARELHQRQFLLHRLVNDFEYHRYTRPKAYEIQKELGENKEETYGPQFDSLNEFVKQDVYQRLMAVYQSQFQGKTFFAGNHLYQLDGLESVDIGLPWPRAYEVRIGFVLKAQEVNIK